MTLRIDGGQTAPTKPTTAAPTTPKPANTVVPKSGTSDFRPTTARPVSLNPQSAPTPSSSAPTFRVQDGVQVQSAAAAERTAQANAVHDSARKVADAYAHGGPAEASRVLDDEAHKLGTPDQVDALIREAKPTIDKISDEVAHRAKDRVDDSDGNGNVTRTAVDSLADVSDLATDAGVDLIADSLGTAVKAHFTKDDGNVNQLDDRFEDLASKGNGGKLASRLALNLINTQGLPDAGNEILNEATHAVSSLRDQYHDAAGEKAKLDQRLAGDLAAFGPGLTDGEKQKYIEAFWNTPDRKAVLDTFNASADKLSNALKTEGPALETLAAQGDEEAAKQLEYGFEDLATNDRHANEAIAFAGRVNQNPALAGTIDDHTDGKLEDRISEKLLVPALPRAQAQAFNAHAGDANPSQGAADELQALLGPLKEAKTFIKIAKDVANLGKTIEKLRAGDYNAAQALLDGFDQQSKLGKALKVVGVAQGIYKGVNDFQDGNVPEGLQDFLKAGKGGLDTAAGLLNTFGKTEQALKTAEFATKLAPYLGLAIDGIQLGQDIHALIKDGADAGEVVSVIGTGISLVGDAFNATGVGEVVGVPLQIVGGALHALGGFISGLIHGGDEQDKLDKDRANLLAATGLPKETQDLLAASPKLWANLGTLGLTREQFLAEAKFTVDVFSGNDNAKPEQLLYGMRAAAEYGLRGQEALDFAHEFLKADKGKTYDSEYAINSAAVYDWSQTDPSWAQDQLDTLTIVLARNFGPAFVEKYHLDQAKAENINTAFFSIDQAVK